MECTLGGAATIDVSKPVTGGTSVGGGSIMSYGRLGGSGGGGGGGGDDERKGGAPATRLVLMSATTGWW